MVLGLVEMIPPENIYKEQQWKEFIEEMKYLQSILQNQKDEPGVKETVSSIEKLLEQ